MYRKQEQPPIPPSNFELTNECKLSCDNRWVIMARVIPWSEFEEEYASFFDEEMGAPAKSFRMANSALIIKEKLGIREAGNSRADQGEPLSTVFYRDVVL